MYDHIGQMIQESVNQNAGHTAVKFKKDGVWQSLTYAEFGNMIESLACALIKAGVNPKDNIGIYSANRYEWAVTDFACALAGAVSVPIYATNTAEQAEFIINDAKIRLIFSGNEFQYKNIETIASHGNALKLITYDHTINIDPGFAGYFRQFISVENQNELKKEIKLRLAQINKHDTATIIYTSGTTGNPKGVMLTHANLFHQCMAVDTSFNVSSRDISLCFLPLSHVYERMWSYFVYFKGATHTYLEDPKKIIETLKEVKPSAMVSVPRLYEKIFSAVMNAQEDAPFLKKMLFQKALRTGKEYACAVKDKRPVSLDIMADS
jgi:long-chain acyl-CoA synthetase